MLRLTKLPFLPLLIGLLSALLPNATLALIAPPNPLEADTCVNVDLNSFEDQDEMSAKITQCSYEFISSVIKNLDEMIDAKILETLKAEPDKARAALSKLVKVFQEREWVFPFLIANKEVLNSFEDIEIIPMELFDWIVDVLVSIYLEPESKKTGYALLFTYMFGGDFSTRTEEGDDRTLELPTGLLDYLKKIDLQSWSLVDNFAEKFVRTTLTTDTSREVSKTFVALVNHYFEFMHVQNRIHILTRMADLIGETNQHGIFLSKLEESERQAQEAATVHLFQNTGPVFIKLLQTLNAAIHGPSLITPILLGIKNSFPMPFHIVQDKLFKELRNNNSDKTKIFSPNQVLFEKKQWIASIGEVHKFNYEGQRFVVKIRKEKVDRIFQRERESILKIVSASISGTGEAQDARVRPRDIFDKGIRQRLDNYMDSIAEELDFRYERANMIEGAKAFTDPVRKITVAEIPKVFAKSRSQDILLMKEAKGIEIGDILNDPNYGVEDKKKGLLAVETLYEKFLWVALDPNQPSGFQYYHGDLHDGNFFLDLKTMLITLIDFGNAGKMNYDLSRQITRILVNTQKTDADSKEEKYTYIKKVAKDFYDIAKKSLSAQFHRFAGAKYYKDEEKNFVETGDKFLGIYFTVCFNPDITRGASDGFQIRANETSRRLRSEAANLNRKIQKSKNTDGFMTREKFQLQLLEENIGLLDAIRNNCISEFKRPILTTMVKSEITASKKLEVVFTELEKNGIGMPREIALFNKSKVLLENIMKDFTDKIKKLSPEFKATKNASTIFSQVVSELNRRQQIERK